MYISPIWERVALREHMGRGRQPGGREGVVNLEYISCIEIGNNLILKWGAYLWVAPKLKFDCVILSTLF